MVSTQEPVVQKSLDCLRGALAGQLDNLYTSALLAYTFTLARDQETRTKLVSYLHQKSSSEGELGASPGGHANLLTDRWWSWLQVGPATGNEPEPRGRVWTPWRWR